MSDALMLVGGIGVKSRLKILQLFKSFQIRKRHRRYESMCLQCSAAQTPHIAACTCNPSAQSGQYNCLQGPFLQANVCGAMACRFLRQTTQPVETGFLNAPPNGISCMYSLFIYVPGDKPSAFTLCSCTQLRCLHVFFSFLSSSFSFIAISRTRAPSGAEAPLTPKEFFCWEINHMPKMIPGSAFHYAQNLVGVCSPYLQQHGFCVCKSADQCSFDFTSGCCSEHSDRNNNNNVF